MIVEPSPFGKESIDQRTLDIGSASVQIKRQNQGQVAEVFEGADIGEIVPVRQPETLVFRRRGLSVLSLKKTLWLLTFLCVSLIPGSTQTNISSYRSPESLARLTAAEAQVEFVGTWPYGRCEACAIDTTRNIALIGNGETL